VKIRLNTDLQIIHAVSLFMRNNHRRAVAQHCINGDCLMENAKIRHPVESKPLNRSPKKLSQMITSRRRTTLPNFVQIRPQGASRQMGEI